MARVIVTRRGKTVASATNLEVLSRYHRKESPVVLSKAVKQPNGRGLLKVRFRDGAKAEVPFASFVILTKFLNTKRKRSGWA